MNPVVQKDLRYDPLASFTLLSQIAAVPDVLAIHPSVPAKDIAQFVDYARRNPGKLNYGTPGVGSLGHLIGETFKYSAKVDLTHVPYRGAGPALNDALAGQVQVLFDNLPSSLPHIQSGKLRALAVASEKRVPALPDIPTYAEAGYPVVNDPSWFGLIAPAGSRPHRQPRARRAGRRAQAARSSQAPRRGGGESGRQFAGGLSQDRRRRAGQHSQGRERSEAQIRMSSRRRDGSAVVAKPGREASAPLSYHGIVCRATQRL